jgi:hypothetical protein
MPTASFPAKQKLKSWRDVLPVHPACGRTLAANLDRTITTLSTAERQAARLAHADLLVEDSQYGRPQFRLARPPRCGARSPMQKKRRGRSMSTPKPARKRLPNRRAAFSSDIEFKGLRYRVSAGYFGDGSLAEIFVSSHKAGSSSDVVARDAGILTSLCLQHGCTIDTIARALSRNSDGSASGVMGAVLDSIIAEREPAP